MLHFLFILLFFIFVIAVIYITYTLQKQHIQRQDTILKPLLEQQGYTFHNHIKGLQKQQIESNFLASEFYQIHFVDKVRGNDFVTQNLITGLHQEIPFRSIDVHCSYEDNGGENSTTITLFRGRIYTLDLKTIPNFTLVVREEKSLFRTKPKGLQEVEYESLAFNKKFNVYTTHPELAFTYIKPQTMEKIFHLEQRFQGKLLLSINNGHVYFGKYDNKEHFKIKVATPTEEIQKMIFEEQQFLSYLYDIFNNILNKTHSI